MLFYSCFDHGFALTTSVLLNEKGQILTPLCNDTP